MQKAGMTADGYSGKKPLKSDSISEMTEINLDVPLREIKGISDKIIEKLRGVGLVTVADMLWHTPIRSEDWVNPSPIADIRADKYVVVRGVIEKISEKRIWAKRLSITEAIIGDATGRVRAVWFNQPYVKRGFAKGDEIIVSGKVSLKGGLFFSSPGYVVIKDGFVPQIVPVYRRPKGVSSKTISGIIAKILPTVTLREFIPAEVLKSQGLLEVNGAIRAIHFPKSISEWNAAKKRFAFESLFLMQLGSLLQKKRLSEMSAPEIKPDYEFLKTFIKTLPFPLTFAQKRTLFEILRDMESGTPMSRLMQGDVGSGKTIVAGLAAIEAARAGYQAAIMAPTEILATQHYETIKKLFGGLNIPTALLTSKICKVHYGEELESEPKKAEVAAGIKSGRSRIIVGTHALISGGAKTKPLAFPNLGLVIIDEQHRFGVNERARLIEGSRKDNFSPHFLSMSATPIPRTLAIALFGDLDISLIDEMPKNRKPVVAKVVPQIDRDKAYAFIRSEIKKGRQAFVVCPMIERESEEEIDTSPWSDVKTVAEEYGRLSKKVFPDLKIGMLHGKMKSEEKAGVMNLFKTGETDILVSTSVIEVGVDVPNATIMMIESADRFGLAQLYQFKGRVGRGDYQSYCLLFADTDNPEALKRLQAISVAKNGFDLAEKDLEIRGPGEFLGENQKGMPDVTMRALQDAQLIKESRAAAQAVLGGKMDFKEFAVLKKKLDHFQKSFHLE